jgi:hypothetical protein
MDDDILAKASPYLFPCVLEYSLLAAAVMFSMYSDVGTHSKSAKNSEDSEGNDHHSFITEINFHRSHKGLFGGVIVIAATCVSVVLFYSYLDQDDVLTQSPVYQLIYHATMIGLYSLLLLITLVAFVQLHALKFNRSVTSSVDDVMLVVAMGGLVLYLVLKLLPLMKFDGVDYGTAQTLTLIETWLALVTALAHTWFLLDGSRRITSTEEQYATKPGRGSVMFLLLTNVALWLYRTFHMKEVEIESHIQEEEYGYLAWQLILHALVPLLIFYHFHSSACLAHIWSGAYAPAPQKPDKKPTLSHATSTAEPTINASFSRNHSPHPAATSAAIPVPRHTASADLVPDRIIAFKRHGKAPPASRASQHTIVEIVESPADTGRSVTWPRLHPAPMANGSAGSKHVVVEVNDDSIGGDDVEPGTLTWTTQHPPEDMCHLQAETRGVTWQLEPHSDDDTSKHEASV